MLTSRLIEPFFNDEKKPDFHSHAFNQGRRFPSVTTEILILFLNWSVLSWKSVLRIIVCYDVLKTEWKTLSKRRQNISIWANVSINSCLLINQKKVRVQLQKFPYSPRDFSSAGKQHQKLTLVLILSPTAFSLQHANQLTPAQMACFSNISCVPIQGLPHSEYVDDAGHPP